jgi:hypothetical protein
VTPHEYAVKTVAHALEHCDPQEAGIPTKAERIVDALEEAGVIHHGRRIEALPVENVAAWL